MNEDQPAESARRAAEDELRPVTVLFADIVGSTALGERLAADEVKVLVGECVTMMSRAVEEYGGTVQAYQGDGICAYFGVPAAHEDDPERAARAGRRILEVVGEYGRDIEDAWGISQFAVRIGINSGHAGVGLVGSAAAQQVALGDATNVGARLQALAEPGTIAVGETTARRLEQRFDVEPLGEVEVKNRQAPVAVFRLGEPKAPAPDRPAASLVDREGELARLRELVAELVAGRGQIVLLFGDAGIGKTRLLRELKTLAGDAVTWLEGHCLSYGGRPAWPFVELLTAWLGVDPGEPEVAVRTKARAKLGALLGDRVDEVLRPLGQVLRLRLEPAGGTVADMRTGYVRWLEELARRGPTVVAVENVHWADAATREIAEELFRLTDRAALALVLTQAPAPGSEGAALRLRALSDFVHRTTELTLGPLPADAARELVSRLLGADVDDATVTLLVRQAEGNALYLEELTRSLAERGALEQRGRTWTITVRRSDLLPPSLESLLVARIDRLAPGPRTFAQAAAAVGRTFPVPLVERVLGHDAADDLSALLRSQIVREVRRYPELECAFTHGLLQDAALSTLTPPRRQELYARIAAAFEELYADALDDRLERIAHYHAQSGNLPKALEYLRKV